MSEAGTPDFEAVWDNIAADGAVRGPGVCWLTRLKGSAPCAEVFVLAQGAGTHARAGPVASVSVGGGQAAGVLRRRATTPRPPMPASRSQAAAGSGTGAGVGCAVGG